MTKEISIWVYKDGLRIGEEGQVKDIIRCPYKVNFILKYRNSQTRLYTRYQNKTIKEVFNEND